ncbi:1,4-alpha-glucan branching protein domain-containing protein [uncultured Brevibacillus sp.]|uniref:1,4-alpha-glucan branching protein domain-containing protein n=1 Tax=uncultured Brevibacillus sp. TaxID=169970 RepID=UPI002596B176|nr:1,4-alpha-glucan branching protein domain-containing protein [uncultured Brevibacillus sp.]
MNNGYLSLVLHAHLPYVRHGDRDDYLEERWVYESMMESYIPLLLVFDRLLADGIDFRMTLAVSPTLLSMLNDELIQERFRAHLAKTVELAGKEVKRTANHPEEHRVAKMYLERFRTIASYCQKLDYKLITGLRHLQENGCVELITCAATHAFLPFVETEEAIRAQLQVGIDTHERILGQRPNGIWLPECGYSPGVDRLLKEAGLHFFFVDSHTINHATPTPRRGLYAPLFTPHDVAAFARDEVAARQVWSSFDGYPGDYDYREYYRDIGFDREMDYIEPYIHPAGIRVHTGLKYYRITGPSEQKEWYEPEWAREKAASHAGHFLYHRERQIEDASIWMDQKPLVVATYDAELFGHWWYEGPQFLDYLLRKTVCDSKQVTLITPSEYLARYPNQDRAHLPMSTWGRNGYGEVWLNERNGWIYRHLHQAERDLIEAVSNMQVTCRLDVNSGLVKRRCLKQAARELMLAQSSDWAFILDGQTVVEYAVRRIHDHLVRLRELLALFYQEQPDEERLIEMEAAYPLFPGLDETYYLPNRAHRVNVSRQMVAASQSQQAERSVLVLSWEFPPHVVGGLGRAVYDLSRHLVSQGIEVHVLTGADDSVAKQEQMDGVHVHRLPTYVQAEQEDFMQWVFQLNLALVDAVEELRSNGLRADVIHAHDWLVGWAAIELKQRLSIPLITTIHALEHGRHQGIHTPLQHRIHECERVLTEASDRVIVCSHYMGNEVRKLFHVASEKLAVIHNGVEARMAHQVETQDIRHQLSLGDGPILFFVGRLVQEKGAHLLVEAVGRLVHAYPDLQLVIAGRGPMLEDLKQTVAQKGVAHHVRFLGFVDDEHRNQLFHLADVAVFPSLYEPFGIVALEAMSFGTPLVVSDTGGLREIVRHGENGATVYAGDVESLVNQLHWMLGNPDKRLQMAAAARNEVLLQYDWTMLAQQTIEQYRLLTMSTQEVGVGST